MQHLVEGIKLFYGHSDMNLQGDRIWLSSGISKARDTNSKGICYCEDAFIPDEPWRLPDAKEKELILTREIKGLIDRNSCIGLVHLPEEISSLFYDLRAKALFSEQDSKSLAEHPTYKNAIETFIDYLSRTYLTTPEFAVNGISIQPPGLKTVTYNSSTRGYIGLHLDSWDQMPLEKRHLSTNRICLNVGSEDRFLLFINLTLKDIYHLMVVYSQARAWNFINKKGDFQSLPSMSKISPNVLIKEFMKTYSSYPVIKLKIAPGEAYIAPTENMIHDGCTDNKKLLDMTFTVRACLKIF